MKTLKTYFVLYALIIGLLLTFSHTTQAQDVPDGFDPNADSNVSSIAVQTDGKILIGGSFTTLNGGAVTRNFIARLGFALAPKKAFDFNGDGKADLAVFRPSSGYWYYASADTINPAQNFNSVQFGVASDKPIPSVYQP